MLGSWRKSTYSGDEGNCVEVAWRRSSRSENEGACVELSNIGAVRDSKNPAGGMLRVELTDLIAAVKGGRFER